MCCTNSMHNPITRSKAIQSTYVHQIPPPLERRQRKVKKLIKTTASSHTFSLPPLGFSAPSPSSTNASFNPAPTPVLHPVLVPSTAVAEFSSVSADGRRQHRRVQEFAAPPPLPSLREQDGSGPQMIDDQPYYGSEDPIEEEEAAENAQKKKARKVLSSVSYPSAVSYKVAYCI